MNIANDVSAPWRSSLEEHGYARLPGLVDAGHLQRLRVAFDRLWSAQPAGCGKVSQHQLLADSEFGALVEHPPLLAVHRALFGVQTQLIAFDLLRQGPHATGPERSWHRDFSFPGDHLLAANTILYLDDITAESGPTWVVPGTHRGLTSPDAVTAGEPRADEVAITAKAGDAALINAAIWHCGSRNRGAGLRRAIYLYFGWWWLKRYNEDQGPLPAAALAGASEARRILLGQQMPGTDLHMV